LRHIPFLYSRVSDRLRLLKLSARVSDRLRLLKLSARAPTLPY